MPNTPQILTTPQIEVHTFEGACDALRTLQEKAGGIVEEIRAKGRQLVLVRFQQGRIAGLALDMPREESYGQNIMQELALSAGMHKRTLYDAKAFFEHPQFGGRESALRAWLEDKEEERSNGITWSYCRNWARKALPNKKEEASNSLNKHTSDLEKKAEKLDQEAEDLRKEVSRRNGEAVTDEGQEALGVASQAKQIASDIRLQVDQMKVKGSGRIESSEYLQYVRSFRCLACQQSGSDPHHITTGGTGMKGNDLFTVPLCREHHNELHDHGQKTFEKKHNLNLWQCVSSLLAQFVVEAGQVT